MNSLPLSPVVTDLFYLQILLNTVALNSYLGLSAFSKNVFFLVCIKFDKSNFIQTEKQILLCAERPRYEFSATA